MQRNNDFPELGFGLGLRIKHYPYIFENNPKVDFFEIISENFMDTDGPPRRKLERIRALYPVALHGVALSIGTVDPLNSEYLTKLKALINTVEPAWVSDHLCWTGVAHQNSHDLLPVPYTEEALKHIVDRIGRVQDYLGMRIALENPSTYLEFKHSDMAEAQFIAEMAKAADCNLLLDVNNVYVTCYNHRLDTQTYLDTLPLDRVVQIHLSGHSNVGTHIIDTHDDTVIDEVKELYRYVVQKAGRVPNTMLERDDNIPPFEELYAELETIKEAAKRANEPIHFPDTTHGARPAPAEILKEFDLKTAQTVMQKATLSGEADTAPESWIRHKKDFPPAEQLKVYQNAYKFRLYNVTYDEYPALKQYLGAESFKRLLDDFVKHTVSRHFNIGRYAALLPAFLEKHDIGQDIRAREICLFEKTISELYDPEETEPLTPEKLAGLTPESLALSQLKPRKALEIFAFSYRINEYYLRVKENDDEESAVTPPALGDSYVAIFRHDDKVWRLDLDKTEYALLQKLFSGEKIGAALEATQKEFSLTDEETAPFISEKFGRWMRNGLLAA